MLLRNTIFYYSTNLHHFATYYTEQTNEGTTIILGYANMKEEELVEATKILCEIWK